MSTESTYSSFPERFREYVPREAIRASSNLGQAGPTINISPPYPDRVADALKAWSDASAAASEAEALVLMLAGQMAGIRTKYVALQGEAIAKGETVDLDAMLDEQHRLRDEMEKLAVDFVAKATHAITVGTQVTPAARACYDEWHQLMADDLIESGAQVKTLRDQLANVVERYYGTLRQLASVDQALAAPDARTPDGMSIRPLARDSDTHFASRIANLRHTLARLDVVVDDRTQAAQYVEWALAQREQVDA